MKIHNILGQGLIAAMAFTLSACSDSHMEEINTDETKEFGLVDKIIIKK